jgi:hypothetical protein
MYQKIIQNQQSNGILIYHINWQKKIVGCHQLTQNKYLIKISKLFIIYKNSQKKIGIKKIFLNLKGTATLSYSLRHS